MALQSLSVDLDPAALDEIEERLADSLDVSSDSVYFNYDSMYIDLPESVVKKIKDDAVREYAEVIR